MRQPPPHRSPANFQLPDNCTICLYLLKSTRVGLCLQDGNLSNVGWSRIPDSETLMALFELNVYYRWSSNGQTVPSRTGIITLDTTALGQLPG